MKEFAAETLTKTAEFERVQHTEKEIEQQRRIEGAKGYGRARVYRSEAHCH